MSRVIRVARKGFGIDSGDENMLYSSEWPVLSIFRQVPINITNPNQGAVIYTHDLGYPPMFWDFVNFTGDNSLPPENCTFFSSLFSVTSNQLLYSPPDNPTSEPIVGYVYLFTLDLSQQYTAPTINIGGVESGIGLSKRVFKLAREHKSVHSSDLRDFVISTDARSPLIHSVNPGTVQDGGGDFYGIGFTVEHNLGYVPLSFGYTNSNGRYFILPAGGGGTTRFASTDEKVIFSESFPGRNLTIVILKDPFEAQQEAIVTI